MPRIRTIKPDASFHEGLFDLEQETGLPIRFVYAVLPCHCDREGRFKWKSRTLGAQILPYDNIDFSRVLDALMTRGFIKKYVENDKEYGFIPTFLDHQVINNRESESNLPKPNENNTLTRDDDGNYALTTREPRVQQGKEGKGREGKGIKKSQTQAYAFEGGRIKLNQSDFDRMTKQYSNLNLAGELSQLDIELQGMTDKQWFPALNAKLNYRNNKSSSKQKLEISSQDFGEGGRL